MRPDEILGLLPELNWDNHPNQQLFVWELLFWAVIVLLTIALIRYRPALAERAEDRLRAMSRHTTAWLLGFVLLALALRVAALPWIPVPAPKVHDEFSFLLAADTFAHGRLTNPPHPLWVHFETFHVNMRPTYQSMYPPAQGMAMAVGQVLTGVPWVGVLLSTALMCGAIYWMLLGWLPPAWAWLGGAFAVVRFGIFSYWVNSYFGGAVTALGAALALGALPRLRRELRAGPALIFAAGLLILANSRPLEGFVFSLPLMIAVMAAMFKTGRTRWPRAVKTAAPAMALLIAGAAGMLYYNWRGTGNPLLMPYVLNFNNYHISHPFFFQKPNPIPQYHHTAMRTFYVYHEVTDLARLRLIGLGYFMTRKTAVLYSFFVWPLLLLLAPAMYRMLCDREFRVVPIAVAALAVDIYAQIWPTEAHYAAPAAGAVILMVLYSLRHFRNSNPLYGLWGTRAVVLVLALWMLFPISQQMLDPFLMRPVYGPAGPLELPLQLQRARMQAELERRPGKYLVLVHHPYHDVPTVDWVYNAADIDHAKVVWAWDMGYEKNKELLAYYPDRQALYVDRGDPLAMLQPYDEAMLAWKVVLDGPAYASYERRKARTAGAGPPAAPRLLNASNPKPASD